MSQILNLDNTSVIDFGCGFGDFGYYLKKVKFGVKYLGLDINQEMVKRARVKYPNLEIQLLNFEATNESDYKCEFCLASGVFNFCQNNIGLYDYLIFNLQWMWDHSTTGIAFNFTTKNFGEKIINEFDVKQVYEIAKSFSNNAVLRDDYLEGDATIFIYK